jgi:hypothetical protein
VHFLPPLVYVTIFYHEKKKTARLGMILNTVTALIFCLEKSSINQNCALCHLQAPQRSAFPLSGKHDISMLF